jgi:hypothetical protein
MSASASASAGSNGRCDACELFFDRLPPEHVLVLREIAEHIEVAPPRLRVP